MTSIDNKSITSKPSITADAAGDAHRAALAAGLECFEAALVYLKELRWASLGLCTPDHMGVGKTHARRCKHPGKAPWRPWAEFQDRLPTEAELRRKWRDNPLLNVGIALGPVSGLVRVDVDGPGGEALLLDISGGDIPDTLEFTSGRENGGRGLLYAIPAGPNCGPRGTAPARSRSCGSRRRARRPSSLPLGITPAPATPRRAFTPRRTGGLLEIGWRPLSAARPRIGSPSSGAPCRGTATPRSSGRRGPRR